MKGLDIWLTTDPNDDIDWGDMGAKCSCGNDALEVSSTDSENNSVTLWCCDCGEEFEFEPELPERQVYEPHCKHCEDLDITCKYC